MRNKTFRCSTLYLTALQWIFISSDTYSASKHEAWIGKVRGDYIILPLFKKEGAAWATVSSGDKFPSKWMTAFRDGKRQTFENLKSTEVDTHCDAWPGLPIAKPTKERSRKSGLTLGVASSGTITVVPFIRVPDTSPKMAEIVKLARSHFTIFQNRTFVPASLYCAAIDRTKELCAYQFEMQGQKVNGCFSTQVQIGWITVQNNQYQVLEKKLLDTDCDYQRISTVSPIGIVTDDNKVQVLIEDEGYEDSTYRILLFKDSQLKQIATMGGGSC